MTVSVIIPVYNVEKYLDRCITSVLTQSYKNIEVILVNDGSTDSSGKRCDDWGKSDERVRVIHKENGGLSSARNVGINHAQGDCFFFLDSDDYLSTDCIETTVEMMRKYNADISIVQMMHIAEETNDELKGNLKTYEEVLSREEAIMESLYQKKFSCCAPGKLFSNKSIGDIRFPEGSLSEDLATCHLFINNSNRIVYSNKCCYYYRQRANSIMHSFNPRRLDAITWAKEIELFCKKNYPRLSTAARCRTFNVAVHLLLDLPDNGKEHNMFYSILWNEIKRTRMTVILEKGVRAREKAAAILSFGGENLLKRIWRSKLAIRRREA